MSVGGFVALCVNNAGPRRWHKDILKSAIHGNFFKIKCPPPFDTIKGKLIVYFNTYRISHGGIKIRLSGRLQIQNQNADDIFCNIFRNCPIQSQVTCKSVSNQITIKFHTLIC